MYDKMNDFGDWTDNELSAFESLNNCLTSAFLALPKDDEELCLKTDASDNCIAAVLETKEGKPVYFCSRTLGVHEKRYDIVEKEALAIFWGVTRLRSYPLGREFIVYSNQKPLEFIFSNDKVSSKVLRWRMQLQEYNFRVIHCSGKSNLVADCLSRINLFECLSGDLMVGESEIISAQKFDKECVALSECVASGTSKKPVDIKDSSWRVRNDLCYKDGVLQTLSGKLFVPYMFCLNVLTVGHKAHCGVSQTICRILTRFFWPGIKQSVTDFVGECRTCALVKPRFIQPPSCPLLCKALFEVLACDFLGRYRKAEVAVTFS